MDALKDLLLYVAIAVLVVALIGSEIYLVMMTTMLFIPLGLALCGIFLGLNLWLVDFFS